MTANVLAIAQEVADELGLAVPDTLYGVTTDGNARKLRRTITAVGKFLNATYDWRQLVFEHTFRTVEGGAQPWAMPADLGRIISESIFDLTRRLPLDRGDLPHEFNAVRASGVTLQPLAFRQGAQDFAMQPVGVQGSQILFSYVSNIIGYTAPIAPLIVRPKNNDLLAPFTRCLIAQNTTVGVPRLNAGEYIELAPEFGSWSRLNANLVSQDNLDFSPLGAINTADIITIARRANANNISPTLGAWVPEVELTTNGQTLTPGKRYVVETGQVLYLPIMRAGQFLELAPKSFSWVDLKLRLISRDGSAITGALADTRVGILTVTAVENGYNVSQPQQGLNDVPPARPIAEYTTDTDTPIWDKELMTLGTVWRMNWRDGQPYNEDFRAFERMIYDRLKGEGSVGVISLNRQRRDYASARMAQLRNSAIVLTTSSTWESTI